MFMVIIYQRCTYSVHVFIGVGLRGGGGALNERTNKVFFYRQNLHKLHKRSIRGRCCICKYVYIHTHTHVYMYVYVITNWKTALLLTPLPPSPDHHPFPRFSGWLSVCENKMHDRKRKTPTGITMSTLRTTGIPFTRVGARAGRGPKGKLSYLRTRPFLCNNNNNIKNIVYDVVENTRWRNIDYVSSARECDDENLSIPIPMDFGDPSPRRTYLIRLWPPPPPR